MGRFPRLVLASAAATLALPAFANAEERTLTFTTPAISVEGYGVAQEPMLAESPKVDGYVVGMEAEVVDAQGRVQGRDKVMLHHIVFAKIGVPDYTCGGAAERFFAEGEERLACCRAATATRTRRVTAGAPLHADEPQAAAAERLHPHTVRYVTGETLTPVKPVWLDVRNCTGPDPVFDVPGGGKRFSTFSRTATFTMPESGRLVSGGGHLHGGGVRPSCATPPVGRSRSSRVRPGAARSRDRCCTSRGRRRCLVPDDCGDPGREG